MERSQDPDLDPRRVEFEPTQAMSRGERERVMIVVPAFAPGQDGNPPAVGGQIDRLERTIAEAMSGAVHESGEVIDEHETEKDTPNHPGDAAKREEQQP